MSSARPSIDRLARTLREVAPAAEGSAAEAFGRPSRAVPSGWETIDGELHAAGGATGLVRGGVHEWLGVDGADGEAEWTPPLFLLAHVARQAVLDAVERGAPSTVIWVGRRVWPYPRALTGGVEVVETRSVDDGDGELQLGLALREAPGESVDGGALFSHSLFVEPPDAGLRLWAIDAALRCEGVTAVVADGSGFGMAATRRLQLAAAAADALVLIGRPPSEIGEVSAATTRWTVARAPDEDTARGPRWWTTLLRAKGAQQIRRRAMRRERQRGVG